jgi:REP element-mobilizing transposase RayT
VTARGNHGAPIFVDDYDRRRFLGLFGHAMERFDAECLAYCLMGNHYHLVVRTGQASLWKVMHYISSVYTQAFNRRHGAVGHLFQGRYHSVVVDSDNHLARVCAYTELNPVRAGLVSRPDAWPWSSYRAHVGHEAAPRWLDVDSLHGHVLGHDPQGDADRRLAAQRYAEWVDAGSDERLWEGALLKDGVFGDIAFAERVRNAGVRPRGA